MDISKYKTLIFDCDGVVLDSNRVKTEAFYTAALPYGKEAAQKLVDYHIQNGGISRYKKFDYFLKNIVNDANSSTQDLLYSYANSVKDGLLKCKIADGLHDLRIKTSNSPWLIVSGGDQEELRSVFSERQLASLFDGGIFGSPDTKDIILQRCIQSGIITSPALFLGDSKYDHQASSAAGVDFVFVKEWTEFSGWEEYTKNHNLSVINSLFELL